MKRSTPLQRRTPLVGDPATHWAWQDRSRARQQTTRRRPRDTGPDQKTKDRLAERSGDRCEMCGRYLPIAGRQIHHRQPRGMGGSTAAAINRLSNLLDLCPLDHALIERDRKWARQRGLLVPRPLNPAGVPAALLRGWTLLGDDGTYTPAEVAA